MTAANRTRTRLGGLTNLEWEILLHRLDCPDAVSEALAEDLGFDEEATYRACIQLARGDFDEAWDHDTTMVAEILVDALDGSTYMALAAIALEHSEISKPMYDRRIDSIKSLAKKVGELAGREVSPALC